MEARQAGDMILLRLEATAGSSIDTAAIATCLDHTVAKVERD